VTGETLRDAIKQLQKLVCLRLSLLVFNKISNLITYIIFPKNSPYKFIEDLIKS
jgi:hypothetical protein